MAYRKPSIASVAMWRNSSGERISLDTSQPKPQRKSNTRRPYAWKSTIPKAVFTSPEATTLKLYNHFCESMFPLPKVELPQKPTAEALPWCVSAVHALLEMHSVQSRSKLEYEEVVREYSKLLNVRLIGKGYAERIRNVLLQLWWTSHSVQFPVEIFAEPKVSELLNMQRCSPEQSAQLCSMLIRDAIQLEMLVIHPKVMKMTAQWNATHEDYMDDYNGLSEHLRVCVPRNALDPEEERVRVIARAAFAAMYPDWEEETLDRVSIFHAIKFVASKCSPLYDEYDLDYDENNFNWAEDLYWFSDDFWDSYSQDSRRVVLPADGKDAAALEKNYMRVEAPFLYFAGGCVLPQHRQLLRETANELLERSSDFGALGPHVADLYQTALEQFRV